MAMFRDFARNLSGLHYNPDYLASIILEVYKEYRVNETTKLRELMKSPSIPLGKLPDLDPVGISLYSAYMVAIAIGFADLPLAPERARELMASYWRKVWYTMTETHGTDPRPYDAILTRLGISGVARKFLLDSPEKLRDPFRYDWYERLGVHRALDPVPQILDLAFEEYMDRKGDWKSSVGLGKLVACTELKNWSVHDVPSEIAMNFFFHHWSARVALAEAFKGREE